VTWVNDKEFGSALALPASRRYAYFVKRAASHGELWGLRGDGGWVVAADDDEIPYFPVWPHRRFAEACAEGPWRGEKSVAVDIDDWVEAWLPKLEEDGMRVAVFQTPEDQGVGVAPRRLNPRPGGRTLTVRAVTSHRSLPT
jgi:catechol 2,3-dioxygenase-like lactoylglutathione lyase family enzyme